MRKIQQIFNEVKGLKEQVGCRVESSIKKILEEIARKEFRTVANVTEKLISERLRDLGFLDKDFQPIEGKSSKK
jgi:hypothetical protein